MTKRISSVPLLALIAVGVAACGSSSSNPGTKIVLAPSQGQSTEAATTASAATGASGATSQNTTTSSASTPTIATPKTGPLSKEPTITVPKGAAPKTLVTKDLIKGTGTVAGADSKVTVNYVGALYKNGKVFDASWKRDETFAAQLGANADVIPGWSKGIPGMKVGGRRELIIPPSEAYGATGGPSIPPNSTLIFVIDLLGVSS